ncbi:lipase 1-like isoform X2 [Coccinella septempunctata]|uniref:lipase 1-like isoform X2 n=1 Tax=Coccinella septempunctata TaxID=41139 RepID=UPI001D06C61F|nr:lipase 1-like isoform X2 [Coccinella septempunctata]
MVYCDSDFLLSVGKKHTYTGFRFVVVRCFHPSGEQVAIARRYGFRLENHKVTTSDGYILTLNRIVPLNGTPGSAPILMHHGICANAAYFILHGKTSTALYLVSIGFDVWLSNARGTEVSMRHETMSPSDPEFWNFSFHEMAIMDIPASLDYIRKKTGGKKVTFIGHSMGGTIQYVYASMMPQHAKESINAIVSLAPVVYSKHMKTEVAKLLAPYTDHLLRQFNMIDLPGTGIYPQLKRYVERICNRYPYILVCLQFVESLTGTSRGNFEPEYLPLIFRRYPAGFSLKTLAHFGQEHESGGRFQMFSYGSKENLLRYNSVGPLEYDVHKINVPVYIIYGEADLLSDEEDNKMLFRELKTEKHIMAIRGANNTVKYTHNDFLFSKTLMDLNMYLAGILRNITSHDNKRR